MADNIYFSIECIFYLFHLSVLILLIVRSGSAFKGPFFHIFRIVVVADLFVFVIVGLKKHFFLRVLKNSKFKNP